jgi:undecaprenyl-diphosphatase
LYGLLPQLSGFKGSLNSLKGANKSMVAGAILCTLATYWAAASIYRSIAIKPLRQNTTVVVQFAAMFINRILPAGAGAIGANAAYLHRLKHTLPQSAAIVGLNNMLGLLGHSLLLVTTLVFYAGTGTSHSIGSIAISSLAIGSAVLVLIIGGLFLVSKFLKSGKLRKNITAFLHTLSEYSTRKKSLASGLAWSVVLTLGNAAALWLCAMAVGLEVSPGGALLALTAGVLAGTLVPTPGGIGAYEGGIYAGFVLQQASPSASLSAALLFRLVNFWLPLAPGFAALLYVRQKNLFGTRR